MAGVVENFAGEIICNEIKGEKPADEQVGQREVWGIGSVLELDCVLTLIGNISYPNKFKV
jgi:hypothetical protein